MSPINQSSRAVDTGLFTSLAVRAEDLKSVPWPVWRGRFGGAVGPLIVIVAMSFLFAGKAIHDNSVSEFAQAKKILGLAAIPLFVMAVQFIFLIVDIKCAKAVALKRLEP